MLLHEDEEEEDLDKVVEITCAFLFDPFTNPVDTIMIAIVILMCQYCTLSGNNSLILFKPDTSEHIRKCFYCTMCMFAMMSKYRVNFHKLKFVWMICEVVSYIHVVNCKTQIAFDMYVYLPEEIGSFLMVEDIISCNSSESPSTVKIISDIFYFGLQFSHFL